MVAQMNVYRYILNYFLQLKIDDGCSNECYRYILNDFLQLKIDDGCSNECL